MRHSAWDGDLKTCRQHNRQTIAAMLAKQVLADVQSVKRTNSRSEAACVSGGAPQSEQVFTRHFPFAESKPFAKSPRFMVPLQERALPVCNYFWTEI
jgi:hypothetical protein